MQNAKERGNQEITRLDDLADVVTFKLVTSVKRSDFCLRAQL